MAPVALAVLTAVFVLAGLQDRSATVSVPVASRSIPVGATIDAGDTRLVKVRSADSALRAGLMSPAAVGSGLVAVTAIRAGDPITRSVSAPGSAGGSGLGSMSIPVPADRADGGAIGPGDRVDVIAASGGAASYLAQGLLVLSSSPKAAGVLGAVSSDYWVTVAVDRGTALRLAAALGSSSTGTAGTVEVVRSTGETAPAPQATFSPSGTPGAGVSGPGTAGIAK